MCKIFMAVLLAAGCITVSPVIAHADRGDRVHRSSRVNYVHQSRYPYHSHWGKRVTVLPRHSFSVRVGRSRYFYSDGLYYRGSGVNYVVVPPPIGAVVTAVPADYQPVTMNGVTYYVNDGVYYVNNGYGYQVVPQPVAYETPAVQPAGAAAASSTPAPAPAETATESEQEVFTINIPNSKGGYTAVDIKKADKGYTGPQGEFYSEFPKVEQLKTMYGQK